MLLALVAGVAWSWDTELNGDLDAEANKRLFARWYEEVYPSADWQLVPELVGPTFVRHEDEQFSMNPDEYGDRLRAAFDRLGPLRIDYEVVAGGDKVAVIGRGPFGNGFLQAWRVRDGRLVESWWVSGPVGW